MRWLLSALVLWSVLLAGGCVSGSGEVIGRSSQEKPSWAAGELEEEPNDLVLAPFHKSEVYRLELGMKQAQAEALAGSKELLMGRVRRDITKRAVAVLEGETVGYSGYFDQVVADIARSFERPDAKVYRTYYEEVRRETSSGEQVSYDVYILVAIPASLYAEAMDRVGNTFLKSNKESIKKLGREILASMSSDSEG
jgi:hypothetical protein